MKNNLDYDKIAMDYAKKRGYDSIRYAGERDGYRYYNYYDKELLGCKTGQPKYIKISTCGNVKRIEATSDEWKWAQNRLTERLEREVGKSKT